MAWADATVWGGVLCDPLTEKRTLLSEIPSFGQSPESLTPISSTRLALLPLHAVPTSSFGRSPPTDPTRPPTRRPPSCPPAAPPLHQRTLPTATRPHLSQSLNHSNHAASHPPANYNHTRPPAHPRTRPIIRSPPPPHTHHPPTHPPANPHAYPRIAPPTTRAHQTTQQPTHPPCHPPPSRQTLRRAKLHGVDCRPSQP